ncbi:aminotransferase class V-fold PLP-dependent enzyme [Priestia endophytica]|uniref:aminotransferase class V-fold PLP-dependent enzyme n=1 Tax=Priestia endophytica TaxID=135735 RepID=UPI000DCA6F45|nr:aminotransferase class V-fold PLP-dependent enzyme [Priestia endophytica]RAS75622.1 aminotransferase [Priestia endophytica]
MDQGILFTESQLKEIRAQFYFIEKDPFQGERLFFDNAGGSFRLKRCVEKFAEIDAIPNCPERVHEMSLYLQKVREQGISDIKRLFNAEGGSVLPTLTASQAMFEMVRSIAENIPGTNMVTTVLEHPSAFDPVEEYARRLGKELRVAKSNPITGGVDTDEILSLIDENTCLLSMMYASNITGAIYDVEEIVKRAREIKPDLYIIIDAVQHVPHGIVDLQKTPVDGINFAPYKFFGCRGSGFAYLSERASALPHHKLIAKDEVVWELGSPTPGHFAVVSEIINYVCWLGEQTTQSTNRRELLVSGMNSIKLHERALMHRMLAGSDEAKGLRELDGVNVYLDYEDLTKRDFIIAMSFDNLNCTQAIQEYEKRGVIVYDRLTTSPYSKRMLESFDLKEVIRVSPLHCHTKEEIDKFLTITKDLSELSVSV